MVCVPPPPSCPSSCLKLHRIALAHPLGQHFCSIMRSRGALATLLPPSAPNFSSPAFALASCICNGACLRGWYYMYSMLLRTSTSPANIEFCSYSCMRSVSAAAVEDSASSALTHLHGAPRPRLAGSTSGTSAKAHPSFGNSEWARGGERVVLPWGSTGVFGGLRRADYCRGPMHSCCAQSVRLHHVRRGSMEPDVCAPTINNGLLPGTNPKRCVRKTTHQSRSQIPTHSTGHTQYESVSQYHFIPQAKRPHPRTHAHTSRTTTTVTTNNKTKHSIRYNNITIEGGAGGLRAGSG